MGKKLQHCIFCNRKAHRGRNRYERGQEPGVHGMGSGNFRPPISPPLYTNIAGANISHLKPCKILYLPTFSESMV